MNRLQQAAVWLRRIGHCRGFGIQSPSDYRFVRYVVNEHWPYYAYAELGAGDDWLRCKLGRLFFRLANYLQPDSITDLLGYEDYLHAGCRKAAISSDMQPQATLILAPVQTGLSILPEQCLPETVVVVEDIGRHPDAWKNIMADRRGVVTFDLYYCGIVFFDSRLSKHHYTVNF